MEKRLYIKEPGSAITHFIGMIMAIIAGADGKNAARRYQEIQGNGEK